MTTTVKVLGLWQGQCRGADDGTVARAEVDGEYLRKLKGQDDAGPVLGLGDSVPEHMLTAQLMGLVLHLPLCDILSFLHQLRMHMHHFC